MTSVGTKPSLPSSLPRVRYRQELTLIHIEHALSDHGDGLVDLVLVTLHQD